MYNSLLGVAAVSVLVASGALAAPEPVAAPPATTPAPSPAEVGEALEKRAACTFAGSTGYSAASASKADCATIVLSALAVPAGVTLDLTDLSDGTQVSLVLISFALLFLCLNEQFPKFSVKITY